MKAASLLVVATAVIAALQGSTSADECTLPELPKFYTTAMQVNVGKIERSSASIEDVEAAKPPTEIGYSLSMAEAVDETMARAVLELDYEFNAGDASLVLQEKVIWDEMIEGIKAYLTIFQINGVRECHADSVHEDSILNAIFGLDPDHPKLPTITQMLHFGPHMGYTCEANDVVNGIPTKQYKAHFSYPAFEGEFDIIYHWSDLELWSGSGGKNRSVPVLAHIEGTMREKVPEGEIVRISLTVVFENFEETEPDPMIFNPPSDIWCKDREASHKLDELPYEFYYDSESIYHHKFPGTETQEINAIRKQSEWYDYRMQVARSDYKPYDYFHVHDPFEDPTGFVKEIKDFNALVAYKIWKDFGNCSVSFIERDMMGDVTTDPEGNIHMTSPLEFWNMNEKFAFNGIHESRGIRMAAYVNSVQLGREKTNYTTVIELTAGTYEEEGDFLLQAKVPVRVEIYPTEKYNDPHFRVRHNIYGFQRHSPGFDHFDITACFFEDAIAHRSIRLGWTEDLVVEQDFRDFETRIRRAIHRAANVSPIRVQNIQVEIVPDESAMYVMFSMVDWPENLNKTAHDDIPVQSTLPLADAVDNLWRMVSDNKFTVYILQQSNNQTVPVKADPSYFETIERQKAAEPSSGKYTPGNMALLAFGMIALGLALGGVVYYFFMRTRVRSLLPTNVRGFENPLSGTSNIADSR